MAGIPLCKRLAKFSASSSVSILSPITKEMYQNMSTAEVASLVQERVQTRLNELIALENA